MKKQIEQVKEFNKVFGIKDVEPILRYDMIAEELDEYFESIHSKGYSEINIDKVEQADAIGDMLYLLFGAVIDAGLEDKIEPILDEIHRSNMSKIEDGVVLRREDGKIQKGKNYFKPNIEQILNK
jgi:predicted HAD superfamily Cof-like phosphohydrolase